MSKDDKAADSETSAAGEFAENPISATEVPLSEGELAQSDEIVSDSSNDLSASSGVSAVTTDLSEPVLEDVVQPAAVKSSYHPREWPGALVGRVPPPIPFLANPRLGKSAEEIIDFPDTIIDSYIHGNVGHAMCVSTRGDGKRHFGTSRQDSCAIALFSLEGSSEADISFLTVADGVGSADMSHFASKIATRTAIETLMMLSDSTESWEIQSREVFREVAESLQAYAEKKEIEIKRLITTLRIAKIVPSIATGTSVVSVANIGDGGTFHLDSSGAVKPNENALENGSADELSPTTKALPHHAETFDFSQFSIEPGEAVVLATDGAVGVWNAGIPLGQLVVGERPETLEIAWALDVRARGHVDDRTIAFWCQK